MILIVPLASWSIYSTVQCGKQANAPRESGQVLSHFGRDDLLASWIVAFGGRVAGVGRNWSGSGPGDPEDFACPRRGSLSEPVCPSSDMSSANLDVNILYYVPHALWANGTVFIPSVPSSSCKLQ
jgi:hypothetical protein